MAQPNNPKLYNMLLNQAKAKWPSHKGPNHLSWPAMKWFGQEYAREGGGYVDSIQQVDPNLRDYKQEAIKKEEEKEAREKANLKKRGYLV